MTTLTEGLNISDVLKYEFLGNYCREKKTIKEDGAAEADLQPGQILENNAGLIAVADGTKAEAILLERVTIATLLAGNSSAVCLVRGPAIVDSNRLTVPGNQKAHAVAALLDLGILCRSEPAKYEEGLATGL